MRRDLETHGRNLAIRSYNPNTSIPPQLFMHKDVTPTSLSAKILKRRLADQELKHQHSEGPMIDFLAMRPPFNHFGREIVECAAKGCSAGFDIVS